METSQSDTLGMIYPRMNNSWPCSIQRTMIWMETLRHGPAGSQSVVYISACRVLWLAYCLLEMTLGLCLVSRCRVSTNYLAWLRSSGNILTTSVYPCLDSEKVLTKAKQDGDCGIQLSEDVKLEVLNASYWVLEVVSENEIEAWLDY